MWYTQKSNMVSWVNHSHLRHPRLHSLRAIVLLQHVLSIIVHRLASLRCAAGAEHVFYTHVPPPQKKKNFCKAPPKKSYSDWSLGG